MAETTLAFALAGLGGFNAHGAGFLQAALDNHVEPQLITATSGQIVVLAAYLSGQPDLKEGLIDKSIENDPFAQMRIALTGYPGVFKPAYIDAFSRLFTPSFSSSAFDIVADRLLPAQIYKPVRKAETIAGFVRTFNESKTGVVFNAYDPTRGTGVLYGNDAARGLMNRRTSIPVLKEQQSSDIRHSKPDRDEQAIWPITPAAIESALWLSLYGFDDIPNGQMDGAYHRSCILSELHNFDTVIVCRPLADGWQKGKLPRSAFDVQDWNTEMWFSVGYKAEIDAMKRINSLIERGKLSKDDYKLVTIHEVEPVTPAGYFRYFIERDSVYLDAHRKAARVFRQFKEGTALPQDRST